MTGCHLPHKVAGTDTQGKSYSPGHTILEPLAGRKREWHVGPMEGIVNLSVGVSRGFDWGSIPHPTQVTLLTEGNRWIF